MPFNSSAAALSEQVTVVYNLTQQLLLQILLFPLFFKTNQQYDLMRICTVLEIKCSIRRALQ